MQLILCTKEYLDVVCSTSKLICNLVILLFHDSTSPVTKLVTKYNIIFSGCHKKSTFLILSSVL